MNWYRFLVQTLMLVSTGQAFADLTISWDYSLDDNSFFASGTSARSCLIEAGNFFEPILQDSLGAISPNMAYSSGNANRWYPVFDHPTTLQPFGIPAAGSPEDQLSIPADTIKVYVGATDLGGALGEAGPGGSVSSWFAPAPFSRGQGNNTSGANANDFAPWGGRLTMDNSNTTFWDYGDGTSCAGMDNDLSTNSHFYSVLVHEIGHVLGIGTADSWKSQIVGTDFTGSNSVTEYGGNVPLYTSLDGSQGHWAKNTSSVIYGTAMSQEAAMDPDLTVGTRKFFTALDVAALRDVGWEITAVPEPSPMLWGSIAFTFVGMANYRRKLFAAA